MGRPLSRKFFSNPTNDGKQLRVSECWIPGASAATTSAWIVQQKGVDKYIITDGTDTGLVRMTAGDASAEGLGYIEVTPFGGGTEYAKQINSHTVKTHQSNVYRWSVDGATQAGDADLPFA